MSAKAKPKKKQKDKQTAHKNFNMPTVGVIDNIVFSKKEAWAYYQLSDKPYDFLSTNAKVTLGNNTMVALGSLCQNADKKVDCHLLITNQPFNPDSWYDQISYIHEDWKKNAQSLKGPKKINVESSDKFYKFIEEQRQTLYDRQYEKRVTYLGIRLFARGSFNFDNINIFEFSIKDCIDSFKKTVSAMFMFDAIEITPEEEKRAREAESDLFRILSAGALRARKPTAEELLLVIKTRLYPTMPSPFLESDYDNRIGLSDIVIETGGTIDVKSRWLKHTQMIDGEEYEGYRATLSFAKFPKDFGFPSPIPPFLYRPEILAFTANCRFSLIPTEEMRKQTGKKRMDTDDEVNNLMDSGMARAPESLRNTLQDLSSLEKDLEEVKLPWIMGSYRITVEGVSEEDLKQKAVKVKQAYAEQDITLAWTSGDQLDLLREEMLGAQLEIPSFQQTTNLALLGIAGVNYGGVAGDPIFQNKKIRAR